MHAFFVRASGRILFEALATVRPRAELEGVQERRGREDERQCGRGLEGRQVRDRVPTNMVAA